MNRKLTGLICTALLGLLISSAAFSQPTAPVSQEPKEDEFSARNPLDPLDKRIAGPVVARNQDIQTILMLLQSETGLQFVIREGIQQKVTFSLDSPTVRQVLEAMHDSAGLTYAVSDDGVVKIAKFPNGETWQWDGEKWNMTAPQQTLFREDSSKSRPETIRKSLSVMCSVLDYMLKERVGEGYQSRSFFSKGVRGYWMPGDGLVFMLGVKFPLIHPEEAESIEDQKREKDLWDKFEEKISQEGGANPILHDVFESDRIVMKTKSVGLDQGRSEFDAQKIETMRETILDALAKYGHRIEGFKEDETITVIVEGQSELSLGRVPVSTGVSIDVSSGEAASRRKDVMVMLDALTESSDSEKKSDQQGQNVMPAPSERPPHSPRTRSIVTQNAKVQIGETSTDELDAQIQLLENELKSVEEIMRTRESDLQAAERELELAKQMVERAKQSFESGRSDQMQMLDSEKQMVNAQKSLNEARRQLVDLQQKMKELQLNLEIAKKNKAKPPKAEGYYNVAIPSAGRISEPVVPNLFFSGEEEPAVMVMQIRFGDLPKEEGSAENIRDKVKITVY
ncbi:MAG: TolC family protein [Candidatus Omnitrophica bacterium]|nr:TolC family protein [Candidatus Omnitrophota bacterium]